MLRAGLAPGEYHRRLEAGEYAWIDFALMGRQAWRSRALLPMLGEALIETGPYLEIPEAWEPPPDVSPPIPHGTS